MRYTREDNFKKRLTDRAQLVLAVEKLLDQGFAEELVPVQLARIFYVDLDELNIALDIVTKARDRKPADQPERLRAVA